MFQFLTVKQTFARAIKLKWDVENFAVVQKLIARISGLSEGSDSDDCGMRVTSMMNVNMKAVMKSEDYLNENLLFEIKTFLFNFIHNLLTKVAPF